MKPVNVNVSVYIKPLCLSFLLSMIFALLTNMYWLPSLLSSALLLLIVMTLYAHQFTRLIDYIWEMSLAFLGLFIGFYLEFGLTDIQAFYELCGQGNMTAIAPITIIGMFIGCNTGMLLSGKSPLNVLQLLGFNLGMLIGMSAFELVDKATNVLNAPLSMLIHLATMLFFGHVFNSFSKSMNYDHIKYQCFNCLKVIGWRQ